MKSSSEALAIHGVNLVSRIYLIRGEKVMLDFDLAMLYDTDNRALKQAVRRNIERFPDDFMFSLSKTEWNELITNCDNLQNRKFSPSLPFAFTEQGVAMLSSVLKSKKAIEVNIAILRAFVQLRKYAIVNKEIFDRIGNLESSFESLKDLVVRLFIQAEKPKRRIGFLTDMKK